VDSGSPYCLFRREVADLIGLKPMNAPLFVDSIGGIIEGAREPVYFQKVSLYLEAGHRLEVVAGFVKKMNPLESSDGTASSIISM
jgi:hypothetical protein